VGTRKEQRFDVVDQLGEAPTKYLWDGRLELRERHDLAEAQVDDADVAAQLVRGQALGDGNAALECCSTRTASHITLISPPREQKRTAPENLRRARQKIAECLPSAECGFDKM
jgi:hypothetical protein